MRYFFGLTFLLLLTVWLKQLFIDIYELRTIHKIDLTFLKAIKGFYYSGTFIEPVILLFAIIGFLIKKPIGWILQVNFFYYFVFYWICIVFQENYYTFFEQMIKVMIPVLLIVLMNIKPNMEFYRIIKSNLLTYNLVSIVISLGIVLLKGFLLIHRHYSIFDIIEIIKN